MKIIEYILYRIPGFFKVLKGAMRLCFSVMKPFKVIINK